MNELKKLIDVKSIVTFIAFYFGTQSNKKKGVNADENKSSD